MILTEITQKIKQTLNHIIYKSKLNKRIYIFPLFFTIILLLSVVVGASSTIFIFGLFFTIITILHTILKLSTTLHPGSDIKFNLNKQYKPFVSIHVACKSEPAEIVNETIKALTKLNYENYEVIVIHSNNQDKDNWLKIRNYVKSCGNKYKFVHLDTVSGFKAGALNYLNDNHMNKNADVVAIVDCDYIVDPEFLNKTVGYFDNPKIGIVQAPQDYSNINNHNIGLFYEYKSFFTLVMNQAQRFDLVNFTGTMGLIRASLLKSDDLKWNENCITEDTEAGTRINSMGYRGIYIDESLGKGLMPYNYLSLSRQRQRWAYGNAQILGKDLIKTTLNGSFNLLQKISFISQLVTWFHFEMIIVIFYLLLTLLTITQPTDVQLSSLNYLIVGSIFFSVIGNLLYFIIGLRKETSLPNRIKAFFVHYGLMYTMSSSWLMYVIGYKLGFNVTSKKKIKENIEIKYIAKESFISVLLLLVLILKTYSNTINLIDVFTIGLFLAVEISGIIYLNRSFIKSKE